MAQIDRTDGPTEQVSYVIALIRYLVRLAEARPGSEEVPSPARPQARPPAPIPQEGPCLVGPCQEVPCPVHPSRLHSRVSDSSASRKKHRFKIVSLKKHGFERISFLDSQVGPFQEGPCLVRPSILRSRVSDSSASRGGQHLLKIGLRVPGYISGFRDLI